MPIEISHTSPKQLTAEKRHQIISPDQVVLGDCMELLKHVEDDSIDLIATDPPYEIGYSNYAWDVKDKLNWDYLAKEFKRIIKPNGNLVIFQGWSNVSKTIDHLSRYFYLKNWIIYDRVKGRGTKTNLVSTREDILWLVNDQDNYTYNKISSNIKKRTGGTIGRRNGNEYRAMSNVWTDISPIVPWSKERVNHPTQKSLQLMDRILGIFSNEGDVVLDCFAGSGSTIISAINSNRKYVGFENNAEYFETMINRIKEIEKNYKLF